MNRQQDVQFSPADLAAYLIDRVRAQGGDGADVLIVDGASTSATVRDGEIEAIDRAEGRDLGLRVFCGASQAVVSASRFDRASLDELAGRAVAMAQAAPPDPDAALAGQELLASDIPDLELSDGAGPEVAQLVATARACEAAGLAVAGVSRSGAASASAGVSEIFLATSTGFAAGYQRSRHSLSATMIAGEGTAMVRDYDFSSAVFGVDLRGAEDVGRSAGERTVRKLDPRKIGSTRVPVLYDRRIAGGLIGHLAGAINGAAIARGTSFLKTDMGKPLFAPGVAIVDDPLRPRGLASRPFDAEGLASARLDVVADGVLGCWLLDCRSARKLGLMPNGRASRGTGSAPSPSSTNLYLEPGNLAPERLMAEAGRGLLVTELMGMGVNGVTGDYSRGASGFWFENGEIVHPVSEITIAGNLRQMFASLTPASDLEFTGTVNAPSCLIAEMTIAGK